MKNKIWCSGKLITEKKKQGRKSILTLEDGTEIGSSSIYGQEIEIECQSCNKQKLVKFYGTLWKRAYVCQSCNKVGENNPFYGKTHSEDFKERQSKERKGSWCVGEKNSMYGINVWEEYFTEEEVEEKKKHLSKMNSGPGNPFYGKSHTEELKEKMSKYWKKRCSEDPSHMRRIQKMALEKQRKGFKSSIEKKVQQELEKRGISFRYSKILNRKYQFDFIIEGEVLLEVHGDYWHANPKYYGDGKKPINETQLFKINLDKKKKIYAQSHGYEIFYIWENEVNAGNFSIIDQIEETLIRRKQ